MQLTTRKQMFMVIIGLVVLIGLGVFSWGLKTGKIRPLASTTGQQISGKVYASGLSLTDVASRPQAISGIKITDTTTGKVVYSGSDGSYTLSGLNAGQTSIKFEKEGPPFNPGFSDVPASYWAYKEIGAAKNAGIIQGYPDGKFKPEEVVTRDQGAVFIARAAAGGDANVPSYTGTPHCNDVPSSTSNWAYKYIEYLFSHGIVTQDTNPLGRCVQTDTYHGYKPTDPLVRGDMAVYLARAKAGGDSKVPAGPATASFSDIPKTSLYYKYVEYGKAQGIFQGYPDGTYQPAGNVNRAQLSVYMVNFLHLSLFSEGNYLTKTENVYISATISRHLDVALAGSGNTATVSGRVVDQNSQPIAGARVIYTLRPIIPQDIIATTDANGHYAISNLPLGSYWEYVLKPNSNAAYTITGISQNLFTINQNKTNDLSVK